MLLTPIRVSGAAGIGMTAFLDQWCGKKGARANDRAQVIIAAATAIIVAFCFGATSSVLAADVSGCSSGHHLRIQYRLGPKSDIDKLYPVIKTESMSDYDYSMAVAASIQLYLQNSLKRDEIDFDYYSLTVTPSADVGYDVSFCSSDQRAQSYGKIQTSWLNNGKLGLNGILACQNDEKKSCWEPTKDSNGEPLTCLAPWQFYLPLGLPIASPKMVMFLHYPPYISMQQSDYLSNATLNRWQRLLVKVGIDARDWSLYATILDVFPIAADGRKENGCFPANSATAFFGNGDKGSGYIPAMLNALVRPIKSSTTIPVIVFGEEAIKVWDSMYTPKPDQPTEVLKAGRVSLDAKAPANMTPYIGANHPIYVVHYTCSTGHCYHRTAGSGHRLLCRNDGNDA